MGKYIHKKIFRNTNRGVPTLCLSCVSHCLRSQHPLSEQRFKSPNLCFQHSFLWKQCRRAAADGPFLEHISWQRESQAGVPHSWLQPSPHLIFADVWRMNHWIYLSVSTSLSLCPLNKSNPMNEQIHFLVKSANKSTLTLILPTWL